MTGRTALRTAWRAVLGFLLVAFLVLTAQATLITHQHFLDVRLPILLVGVLASAPAWLILVLAARTRGASLRWLAVAAAWGAFASAFLAFVGEDALAPLARDLMEALKPFGQDVAGAVPGTLVAPIIEEPAKAIGTLIALAGVRRAAPVGPALGAAVGGLVGLAFGIAESSHYIGEVVENVGYFDLSGVFVIDWNSVWYLAELQLVQRLFLLGLTNHALFSALAGVAIVLLLRRRWLAAFGWFLTAIAVHGLYNAIGVRVADWVFRTLVARPGEQSGLVPDAVAAWLAAASQFTVAEAWAAVLLVRKLKRGRGRNGDRDRPPAGSTGGSPAPVGASPAPAI
jgi:RsiW-degrading membrane proteinase PrsW (M82 family)